MNASLLSQLTPAQRQLVSRTETKALAELDEDAVADLHAVIRREARKHRTNYRRGASAKVSAKGGRGKAAPTNTRAALQAEAFEEALARVSRRLGVLAAATAAELKAERLAAAASSGTGPDGATSAAGRVSGATASTKRASTRTPASAKKVASSQAAGARRQAKRDAR